MKKPGLWFVVPAHGRVNLARICLEQLRRTCDLLTGEGVEASAVVIACDENLDTARALGFSTVERDNRFLSKRFNDGIQLALDPDVNPRPADYVVPCGSDDWVDHRLFLDLPDRRTMVGFQRASFVREDGREINARSVSNIGGVGIRIYPRQLMEPVGYRPADEDRARACDTSILVNLQRYWNENRATRRHGHDHDVEGIITVYHDKDDMRIEHRHLHDRQIVDWKSYGENLNAYEALQRFRGEVGGDPFTELAEFYPAEALEQMREHYGRVAVAA